MVQLTALVLSNPLFHNLCKLETDLKNCISLNDNELADLACGWPLLQSFHLVSRSESSASNKTLQGLLSFVTACPMLAHVDTCLDVRDVPTSRGSLMDVSSVVVKELSFPGLSISGPWGVVRFLLGYFSSIIDVPHKDNAYVKVRWYLDYRDSLIA